MSYKELKSFQQATIIYDFTVEFCRLYVDMENKTNKNYKSRMTDQMVQAARSGKQNIAEGAGFSRTSNKIEIKLTGVSRASLEELLEDYIDFLRQRNLKIWEKDSKEAQEARALTYRSYKSCMTYKPYLSDPERAANAMICLISQTNFLLDKQINALEQKFVEEGGYTEKLFKKRLNFRKS